jgi:hypothetical protein
MRKYEHTLSPEPAPPPVRVDLRGLVQKLSHCAAELDRYLIGPQTTDPGKQKLYEARRLEQREELVAEIEQLKHLLGRVRL